MKLKRKHLAITVLLCLFFAHNFYIKGQSSNLKMWYDKPASVWNEALPIGNGRLAAMIYGDPVNEKIQLNEETFWSGGPSQNNNTDALKTLPEVRRLIFDGKYKQAEDLINKNIRAKQLHGSMYQVVGNLNLNFADHGAYSDYYRELDLEKAVFATTYRVKGASYKREVFASQPDNVIVVRLTASEQGKLSFTASMDGALQKTVQALDNNTLEMKGISGSHEGVAGQVKFDVRTKIINSGGSSTMADDKISITGADEVTILISIATNFLDYKTLTVDETDKCVGYLASAVTKSYTKLKSDHIAVYQKIFNRVSLYLGTSAAADFPTDIRIKYFSKTEDPELVAMYYQFGRYLLISSSQPGGQPANLQGVWNDQTNPAWDSKYTININTEMNYWPAEKCNMPEMHLPLIQMIKELSETGQQTAKTMYGCDGWVAHHNTDIWRITGVVDGAFWGMWPMGGAWLSQHLWEKYLYSGDTQYLESVYPIMKSACEFYMDFLVEEPIHKWLVVSPSISPENAPAGHGTSVCAGATMDNQLLFDLFSKTIRAAKILNQSNSYIKKLTTTLDRLPPMQIGRYGQIQEWMKDLDNPDDKHRHISHLYGLYPGNQISPFTSPQLFDAARTTLVHRGDVSTGWSMGWKVNFWARLLDGNRAHKLISDQLTLVDPLVRRQGGGTYPNFFDSHPPFQIDGNFGCASGISEMLMQTHDGAIHLLPALPDAWKKKGEITGLRAYGGFEISFKWEDGMLQKIEIKSNLGGNCRIRVPNEMVLTDGTSLQPAKGENPNQFFLRTEVKEPLVVDFSVLNNINLEPIIEYDIPTKAGETLTFVKY